MFPGDIPGFFQPLAFGDVVKAEHHAFYAITACPIGRDAATVPVAPLGRELACDWHEVGEDGSRVGVKTTIDKIVRQVRERAADIRSDYVEDHLRLGGEEADV